MAGRSKVWARLPVRAAALSWCILLLYFFPFLFLWDVFKHAPPTLFTTVSTVPPNLYQWVSLSNAELAELLSKEELASMPLNKSDNGTCDKRRIEKSCCLGSISQGGSTVHFPGMCYADIPIAAGIFQQRYPVNYRRAFRVQGQATLYDILDVINTLVRDGGTFPAGSRRNKTVVFLGDSLMHQVYEGILCEVGRLTGKPIVLTEHRRKLVDWIVGSSSRFVAVSPAFQVKLVLYREYRPAASGLTIKEACAEADVLVFNYGVHWRDLVEYEQDMKSIGGMLKENCKGVRLIFRGSTSQHFLTHDGMFSLMLSRVSKEINDTMGPDILNTFKKKNDLFHTGCRPQMNPPPQTRDEIARAMFIENGFELVDLGAAYGSIDARDPRRQVIHFIPLEDITKGLYDMHHTECTHYCSSPLLWAPISHFMYKAIGRPFTKVASSIHTPPPWIRRGSLDPTFQIKEFLSDNNGVYKIT